MQHSHDPTATIKSFMSGFLIPISHTKTLPVA